MPAAAVVAVGAVAGAVISSQAAKSAASKQAKAIRDAQETQKVSAAQARTDILDTMVPALADYGRQVQESRNEIISGTTDVMNILQNSTQAASGILDQTAARASSALLGVAQPVRSGAYPMPSTGAPMPGISTEYQPEGLEALAAKRAEAHAVPSADEAASAAYANVMSQLGQRPMGRDAMESGATAEWDAKKSELETQATQAADTARSESMAAAKTREAEGPGIGAPGGPALSVDQPLSMGPTGGFVPGGPAPGDPGGPALDIGFAGADTRLQEGLQGGLGALSQGARTARGDIVSGMQKSLGSFQPYSEAGRAAIEREAALSGAYGPEAQAEAQAAFMESPGQKYLREQQEQALLRNQAAIGGLGGGRVRTALQEQAMGIASTQQQQYLENLRSIAGRGQQVAGAEANIYTQAGTQLAGIAQQLGMTSADLMRMNASERAALAERTGINVAQLEQTIGTAQAGLASGLGAAQAGVRGAAGTDLAQLAEREGLTRVGAQQNISSQLANLAVGAGSRVADLQAQEGAALAAGTMASGQAIAQGVTSLGTIAGYGMQQPGAQQPAAITAPGTQPYPLTPINQPGPVHVGAGGTTAYGM